MQNRLWMLTVMAGLAAITAHGAFTKPSEAQIKQAADNPAMAAALVEDANVDEAVLVIKDVLLAILDLKLDQDVQNVRIILLVEAVFNALPNNQTALAAALGRTLAASPSASGSPLVMSLIQQTVIRASAAQSAALGAASGAAFGNAYSLAMQSIAGAPSGGKMVPPTPPPPPVILPYSGQRLR